MKFSLIHDFAKSPSKATTGSACFDLYYNGFSEVILSQQVFMASTGVILEIPEGHVGLLFIRSGLGKKGILLANGVGVIDSDFRGEVKLLLYNGNSIPYEVQSGDRIAQLMILPIPDIQLEQVSIQEISNTERGSGGFGSTGR